MPSRRPEWKCDNCGCCCRLVGIAHPDMAGPDGLECRHLKDGKCLIYDDRPYFCNVVESYRADFRHMPFERFEKVQKRMCRAVRTLFGIVDGRRHDDE